MSLLEDIEFLEELAKNGDCGCGDDDHDCDTCPNCMARNSLNNIAEDVEHQRRTIEKRIIKNGIQETG